jgi:hypothetical protein
MEHSSTYAEAWTCCIARHLTGTGGLPKVHACTDCRGDHEPDRAAQDTGEGDNSDYEDLGLEVDDNDPTDSYSPLSGLRTGVGVLQVLMRK